MIFLDVNKNNVNNAEKLQKMIDTNKNIFVLVYMIGCSPCKNTMPQWKKLRDHKGIAHLKRNDDIIVANIEQSMCQNFHHKHLQDIMSFPTIKHIKHDKVHNYEQERTTNAFSDWINNIIQEDKKSNMDIDNMDLKQRALKTNYGNIDMLFKTRKLRRKSRSKSRLKSRSKSRSKSKWLMDFRISKKNTALHIYLNSSPGGRKHFRPRQDEIAVVV